MSTKPILSKHEDVVELATKVGQDIGAVAKLQTTAKTNLVVAINELKTADDSFVATYAKKTELTPYAKKTDLTPLATKTAVAKDIGNLTNLPTSDKSSVVASIIEVVASVDEVSDEVSEAILEILGSNSEFRTNIESTYATKTELTPLATKVELTKAITDLINGADADSDTLKELADKITALAQADNGLVSAEAAQSFNEDQQQQARDNIGAISEADVSNILEAQSKGDYVSAYLQANQ